jgi:hypothetical protein
VKENMKGKHVEYIGYMRNTYKILIGKSESKKPLGGHRVVWNDNM